MRKKSIELRIVDPLRLLFRTCFSCSTQLLLNSLFFERSKRTLHCSLAQLLAVLKWLFVCFASCRSLPRRLFLESFSFYFVDLWVVKQCFRFQKVRKSVDFLCCSSSRSPSLTVFPSSFPMLHSCKHRLDVSHPNHLMKLHGLCSMLFVVSDCFGYLSHR